MKIIACYDNGGKTADRYTIVFNSYYDSGKTLRDCLALSSEPNHPQGISLWSSCQMGRHLGEKISFNELPSHLQKHIEKRIE